MKRRWLIASVATAALVAVGVFGGTVLAQDTAAEPESKGIFGRAAEILGIGEQDLKDAFKNAGDQIRDERRDAHIDRLVEDGVITEEEAAELREWLESRPEVADKLLQPFGGPHFGKRFHGPRLHDEFVIPKGGILPPDVEFFERFGGLRKERGFGMIDGHGFRFYRSGTPDGSDDEVEDESASGSGMSL